MKARRDGGIQYESSQSQSVSSDNSQTHDELNEKKILDVNQQCKEDCEKKIIADKPIKSQQENKSSCSIKQKRGIGILDDTDSGSDVTLKSQKTPAENSSPRRLRERKLSHSSQSSRKEQTSFSNNTLIKNSPTCSETLDVSESVEKKRITTERKKSLQNNVLVSPSLTRHLSHSPQSSPVVDDFSSQLDNIKKELKRLEAKRLADLKERICKA